jgi:hypothetical protein
MQFERLLSLLGQPTSLALFAFVSFFATALTTTYRCRQALKGQMAQDERVSADPSHTSNGSALPLTMEASMFCPVFHH